MSILITVGLPARGKSYISQKLKRSLKWLGYKVKVFNAGQWRRDNYDNDYDLETNGLNRTFFNNDSIELRNKIAIDCFSELLKWIDSENENAVAIFDATNTTLERSQQLKEMVNNKYKIIFIE